MTSRYESILYKFRTENCPCFGCKPPVRHGGCQAECEVFHAYDEEYKKLKRSVDIDKLMGTKKYPKSLCDRKEEERRRQKRT